MRALLETLEATLLFSHGAPKLSWDTAPSGAIVNVRVDMPHKEDRDPDPACTRCGGSGDYAVPNLSALAGVVVQCSCVVGDPAHVWVIGWLADLDRRVRYELDRPAREEAQRVEREEHKAALARKDARWAIRAERDLETTSRLLERYGDQLRQLFRRRHLGAGFGKARARNMRGIILAIRMTRRWAAELDHVYGRQACDCSVCEDERYDRD